MSSKTVLVTGGAGFIGSNFTRFLFSRHPNYRIIVLDSLTYAGNLDNLAPILNKGDRVQFWHGDVRNSALVLDLVSRVDAVVHFAAETHVARSIHDDRRFFETDVLGTQAVANAVLRNRNRIERLIHISSSEVYGSAVEIPMSETHPLNPMTPYAAAKAGADRLVYSYVQTYGLPAVILRLFNQYGPYQHLEKVIPRFITSAILNEPLTIHGDGSASRDWLYVADTCEWIERALLADMDLLAGEVINLGSGEDRSILSIAKLVLEMTGKDQSLIRFMDDRPGQVKRHLASTQKAQTLLGIKVDNEGSFENGLQRTIRWYSDNRKWWEKSLAMRQVSIMTENGTILYY